MKSKIVIGVVVVLAIVVVVVNLQSGKEAPRPTSSAYFVDLDSKEMVALDARLVPPVSQEGKTLVRAYAYGCGDCSNPKPAYLERFSGQTYDAMSGLMNSRGGPTDTRQILAGGQFPENEHEVSLVDEINWVTASSPEGQDIQSMDYVRMLCDRPGDFRACEPSAAGR